MQRKSSIDSPGALHHVIGRGIDRRKIFLDKSSAKMIIGRAKDNWDRRTVAVAQPWPRPGLQGYQVDPGLQHNIE